MSNGDKIKSFITLALDGEQEEKLDGQQEEDPVFPFG
jgi:hypothetical protein